VTFIGALLATIALLLCWLLGSRCQLVSIVLVSAPCCVSLLAFKQRSFCLLFGRDTVFACPFLAMTSFHALPRLFLVASGVARVDITPLKKGDARAVKRVRSSGVEEYSDDDPSDSDSDGTDAQGEKELILLSLGDYFGENSLLGETDYGATLPGFFVTITAVTMLMCMILTRENFREIVATYPFSLQEDVRGMEEDYHLAKKKKKKVEKAKHAQIIFKWGKLVGKLRSSFGIGKASTGLSDRFGKRLLRKLTVTAGSAASDEDVWSQDRRGGDTMSSEEDRASESAQSREPAGIDSFSRRGAAWTDP